MRVVFGRGCHWRDGLSVHLLTIGCMVRRTRGRSVPRPPPLVAGARHAGRMHVPVRGMRRSAARCVAYFGANGPYRKRGAGRLRTTAPEAAGAGGHRKSPPVRTGRDSGGLRFQSPPVTSGAHRTRRPPEAPSSAVVRLRPPTRADARSAPSGVKNCHQPWARSCPLIIYQKTLTCNTIKAIIRSPRAHFLRT